MSVEKTFKGVRLSDEENCLSFRTFRRNMGCRIFPKRSVT